MNADRVRPALALYTNSLDSDEVCVEAITQLMLGLLRLADEKGGNGILVLHTITQRYFSFLFDNPVRAARAG